MGALGLGDPAVQLGDPDVRLHRALPHDRHLPRPRDRRTRGRRRDATSARSRQLSAQLRLGDLRRRPAHRRARPGLGQRADASGRRKFWLAIYTGVLVARACSLLFFVQADSDLLLARRGAHRARHGLQRARRRQLQRDARPGVDPEDRRPGQRPRLGPRLHRRHRRARDRHRPRPARLVRHVDRATASPSASSRSARAVWTILFVIPIFLQRARARSPGRRAEQVSFFKSYVVLVTDIGAPLQASRARPSGSCSRAPSTATASPASSPSARSSPP